MAEQPCKPATQAHSTVCVTVSILAGLLTGSVLSYLQHVCPGCMYTAAHYYHLVIFLFHISALISTGKTTNYHGDELHTNSTRAVQLKSIIIWPGDVTQTARWPKIASADPNMPQDGERIEGKLLIHLKYWCTHTHTHTGTHTHTPGLNTSLRLRLTEWINGLLSSC